MLNGLLAAALLAATAPSAPAPQLPADEQARFKALVLEGERQFGEADYGMAIWDFRQAEAIRVTPELAFDLARACEKLGDSAMAAFYYRLYLRRAPGASDALEVAGTLGELLSRAEGEGWGLLEVDAPISGTVSVDGKTWPDFPLATFLPPGDYVVTARFGEHGETRKVSVATGRIVSLFLEPFPAPLVNASGAEDALSLSSSSGGRGARPVLHLTSWAVMGASALALVAGGVVGVMSRSDAGALSNKGALTVSEAQALARSANAKGGTANVLFGVGAAGLLAGGVMFAFTLPEPGEGAATAGGAR